MFMIMYMVLSIIVFNTFNFWWQCSRSAQFAPLYHSNRLLFFHSHSHTSSDIKLIIRTTARVKEQKIMYNYGKLELE